MKNKNKPDMIDLVQMSNDKMGQFGMLLNKMNTLAIKQANREFELREYAEEIWARMEKAKYGSPTYDVSELEKILIDVIKFLKK